MVKKLLPPQRHSFNFNSNDKDNNNFNSNITSILNYNYTETPLIYSTIIPGEYELSEIAELRKEETNGKVIIEVDKNTMKYKLEIKQGALSFDIENPKRSLLGLRKVLYRVFTYTSPKIVDIMGFNTIKIHSNIISGTKDNGKDTDILYTFILTEPPGYMIINNLTNIL